jgi:uncharacterized damage-inducible protein DinB
MTYYGPKELAESFRTVRKNTIVVAEDIPESQYNFKPADDVRTVEKMLTHIALATRFQIELHGSNRLSLEGFDFMKFFQELSAEEAKPRTKAEVIELLKTEGEKWAAFVDGFPEESLSQVITMPPGGSPPQRGRMDMMLAVKEHEMHHRGQLMLIERILGIVPHLTRNMQARMAAAQAAQAAQGKSAS